MGKDATAMTDGNHIVINMENSLFADATLRSEKVKRVIGTLLHEAAHILFTDFKVSDKCKESFRSGKFFPEDDSPEFDSWKEWTKENKVTPKMEAYYFNLLNILEDGYIDRRIMKEIPGYAECRQEVLDYRSDEYLRREAASEEENSDNGVKFLNAVLAYAKYGLLPTNCEEKIREAVYKVKYYIDLVYKENRFLNRATNMVKIVNKINEYCREKNITDGVCGVRELIDWVKATMIRALIKEEDLKAISTVTICEAAFETILAKVSFDENDKEDVITSCVATTFTSSDIEEARLEMAS